MRDSDKHLKVMIRGHEHEATKLRNNRFAVRPVGQLGTMGYHPYPWQAVYVKAPHEAAALRIAAPLIELGAAPRSVAM